MAASLIPLYDRRGEIVAFACVDAGDHDWLNEWNWHFYGGGYAGAKMSDGQVLMHRLIRDLGRGDARQVDHKNRNRLDNRRANLRIVTRAEQQQNLPSMGGTSRFRGVSFCKHTGRWRATVVFEGKQHSCGRHDSEIDAAVASERFRLANMTHAVPTPELAALV